MVLAREDESLDLENQGTDPQGGKAEQPEFTGNVEALLPPVDDPTVEPDPGPPPVKEGVTDPAQGPPATPPPDQRVEELLRRQKATDGALKQVVDTLSTLSDLPERIEALSRLAMVAQTPPQRRQQPASQNGTGGEIDYDQLAERLMANPSIRDFVDGRVGTGLGVKDSADSAATRYPQLRVDGEMRTRTLENIQQLRQFGYQGPDIVFRAAKEAAADLGIAAVSGGGAEESRSAGGVPPEHVRAGGGAPPAGRRQIDDDLAKEFGFESEEDKKLLREVLDLEEKGATQIDASDLGIG